MLRITETVHFAEFSLKLLHIVFSSLETLSRRNQDYIKFFFKLKNIGGMLLVQSFFYILMFSFCVFFLYRKYSTKAQITKMYLS